MSVEIDWPSLTTGPEGDQLALQIRNFLDARFQTVVLPRFLNSVRVHDFRFGAVSPEVVLRDVCDPLPEFYEDDDDEEDDDEDQDDRDAGGAEGGHASKATSHHPAAPQPPDLTAPPPAYTPHPPPPPPPTSTPFPPQPPRPPILDTSRAGLRYTLGSSAALHSPSLLLPHTPGLGTSAGPSTGSMSYFNLPLAAAAAAGGRSGFSTPGLGPGTAGLGLGFGLGTGMGTGMGVEAGRWRGSSVGDADPAPSLVGHAPTTTSHSHPSPHQPSPPPPQTGRHSPKPTDTQIVLSTHYNGPLQLSLTASILLDYPMANFVQIPVRLKVVYVRFKGVALVAAVGGRRVHFCFLGRDAGDLLGGLEQDDGEREGEAEGEGRGGRRGDGGDGDDDGGLLSEIRIESEIGREEDDKDGSGSKSGQGHGHGHGQVLKNVEKVEKFVLRQVRRIFEEELVFPSFWTFLV